MELACLVASHLIAGKSKSYKQETLEGLVLMGKSKEVGRTEKVIIQRKEEGRQIKRNKNNALLKHIPH